MIPGTAIHILVALVWMFLSGNTTPGGFGIGLLAGFALMALFKKALGCQDYIRRMVALVLFGGRFLKQVVASNLRIARVALQKDAGKFHGYFMTYAIDGLTQIEILILCQCISLTPGTIVAEKSKDGRDLILHAFASGDAEEVRLALDEGLKRNILAFTR